MNGRMKKRITAAAGIMLCAVMAGLLWQSLEAPAEKDAPLPAAESAASGAAVRISADADDENQTPVIQINPEIQAEAAADDSGNGAVFKGTEQTIQADPVKPQYSDADLTNQDTAPDGTPAGQTPEASGQDSVSIPPPQQTPPPLPKPSGGGLPGFDNVPDGGANQVVTVDGEGDINKQVGIM
jgi:hypothetical protein